MSKEVSKEWEEEAAEALAAALNEFYEWWEPRQRSVAVMAVLDTISLMFPSEDGARWERGTGGCYIEAFDLGDYGRQGEFSNTRGLTGDLPDDIPSTEYSDPPNQARLNRHTERLEALKGRLWDERAKKQGKGAKE